MSEPRTHTAAIGLTFHEWDAWRAAAKSAGYEHTSDWVREVVGAAITSGGGDDPKRELARELANIGANLGAITDALESQGPEAQDPETHQAAREATDRAAAELGRLAGEIIARW